VEHRESGVRAKRAAVGAKPRDLNRTGFAGGSKR
jgi:hypothetical protein